MICLIVIHEGVSMPNGRGLPPLIFSYCYKLIAMISVQLAIKINAYLARHRIKPGITGLAQISGYRSETETLDKMERRVELDLAYINGWSLAEDINILVKTPFTLLGKDIY